MLKSASGSAGYPVQRDPGERGVSVLSISKGSSTCRFFNLLTPFSLNATAGIQIGPVADRVKAHS